MLSYENISQNSEILKPTTGLETDDFQATSEISALVFVVKIPNFMMLKITRSRNVILKILNLH